MLSFAKLDDTHYHYGIAFLLGFLGLKGIEYFSSKILPDDVNITHHNIKTSTSCDASLVVDTPIEDPNNDLKVKKVRKLRVRK